VGKWGYLTVLYGGSEVECEFNDITSLYTKNESERRIFYNITVISLHNNVMVVPDMDIITIYFVNLYEATVITCVDLL